MKTFITTLILTLTSTLAFAAERTDNSMTLVYGFLGLCGLIIFLQVLPVLAVAFGIIRAFIKRDAPQQ